MTHITDEIVNLRKQKLTYEKIGDIVGLTKERIRQILKKEAPKLTGHSFVKRTLWGKQKTITCKTCGKEFTRYASVIRHAKYPARFCSRKCYNKPKPKKRP